MQIFENMVIIIEIATKIDENMLKNGHKITKPVKNVV